MSGFDSRGDRKGTFWLLEAESAGSSHPSANLWDRLDQLPGLAGPYQSWTPFSLLSSMLLRAILLQPGTPGSF